MSCARACGEKSNAGVFPVSDPKGGVMLGGMSTQFCPPLPREVTVAKPYGITEEIAVALRRIEHNTRVLSGRRFLVREDPSVGVMPEHATTEEQRRGGDEEFMLAPAFRITDEQMTRLTSFDHVPARMPVREDPSLPVDVFRMEPPTKFVRSTDGCSVCQLVRLALAQYGTTDGRVLLKRALEVLESDHA